MTKLTKLMTNIEMVLQERHPENELFDMYQYATLEDKEIVVLALMGKLIGEYQIRLLKERNH